MKLTQIRIVSVPVGDQDAAKAFYTGILGFEVIQDTPIPGMRWVELGLPGAATHLTLVNWFPQMPAGSMQGLVIETDDVQAVYDTCKARGLDVDPVEIAPWGQYVTLSDPDGNGLVIQQSTRPDAESY